jgi:hypothetical protein
VISLEIGIPVDTSAKTLVKTDRQTDKYKHTINIHIPTHTHTHTQTHTNTHKQTKRQPTVRVEDNVVQLHHVAVMKVLQRKNLAQCILGQDGLPPEDEELLQCDHAAAAEPSCAKHFPESSFPNTALDFVLSSVCVCV